ncbi:hypothetical protein PMAYCL1PPCAC_19278, partial [Pristionchus mayeri]
VTTHVVGDFLLDVHYDLCLMESVLGVGQAHFWDRFQNAVVSTNSLRVDADYLPCSESVDEGFGTHHACAGSGEMWKIGSWRTVRPCSPLHGAMKRSHG